MHQLYSWSKTRLLKAEGRVAALHALRWRTALPVELARLEAFLPLGEAPELMEVPRAGVSTVSLNPF